ncbi:MAG: type II/IV secretion system ATPase subunit [Candidatus Diapherotrites archaeon]|nr:type II/IV secretion system ATPase subunit [Candidatus Diapherotrites archaeon]
MDETILKEYEIKSQGINIPIKINELKTDFVKNYILDLPELGEGTKALLNSLKISLITDPKVKAETMLDAKEVTELKKQLTSRALKIIEKEAGNLSAKDKNSLIALLLSEMLGLGKIEFILDDPNLEEIVINSAHEPVWVYHKEFAWLKTNILIKSEEETHNFASIIARRVGKQVTILNPLLDAHLLTGDRVNSSLQPISGGNTITIRRFRRDPWTVTDFIENKTVSSEVMALIWLAMQYEMNIILSGGTASGKTSFLNVCLPFIQPNHRIISMEDTRELNLPNFMHWVPMSSREPNPEGKGGIELLDLLVNSLRMRPDRIIVGEIRRQTEAEVMFEAMHTGHSVYTTFHANNATETIRRFINPPISIAPTMLESVHLNVVMFRNRRLGLRRVLEVAEYIPEHHGEQDSLKANTLYRWRSTDDSIGKANESIRLIDELGLHTGLSPSEINEDLIEKKSILDWMVEQKITGIYKVGRLLSEYYKDKKTVLDWMKKKQVPSELK